MPANPAQLPPGVAGSNGGRNDSVADDTDHACAPIQGDAGTAANFVAGVRATGSSAEISPGVWNENSCKSG